MRNKFKQYANFCEICGRYYSRLKKHVERFVCIDCCRMNHNLRKHYPEEEIIEFLSTTKQQYSVDKEGKVYKVYCIKNNTIQEVTATENGSI